MIICNAINSAKIFKNRVKKALIPTKWPHPDFPSLVHDPKFLFIFNPPFSGSTALAKILNTSQQAMMLNEKGEGQWLVLGLCEEPRWNPNKYIDWGSVEKCWLNRIKLVEDLVGKNFDIVIEKSPPNLIRAERLLTQFPNHQILVYTRNPYAICSSTFHRHFYTENLSKEKRIEIFKQLAKKWLNRAEHLNKLVENHDAIFFTYEEFCEDPTIHINKIINRLPCLRDIDSKAKIKVKDYELQGIVNQNSRQISKLSELEKELIGNELINDEKLLNFFGYTSNWKISYEKGGAGTI